MSKCSELRGTFDNQFYLGHFAYVEMKIMAITRKIETRLYSYDVNTVANIKCLINKTQ